ncbi:MAG TPA: hypothetical protein VLL76_01935, partial [Candidatus Omnitrophota bacterium]|nr:hypothetical protein [Candidatus Omnitrophota bacterium]
MVPVFRSRASNLPLIQIAGDDDVVVGFTECDVDYRPLDDGPITAAGQPLVYAFLAADGGILAGTRPVLAQHLAPMVDDGTLDAQPMTRAEIAEFCGMQDRLRILFPAAFDYLARTGCPETAWRWKIHSTITPALRSAVAARLRRLGENEGAVARLCRSIRVRRTENGLRATIDIPPGSAGNPIEVLERQLADPALFGEAAAYWADLEGLRPEIRRNTVAEKRLGSLDIGLNAIGERSPWI